MQSLRELQRAFHDAILFDDRAALASLGVVAGALSAQARIAIYRNNVLGNYRKALAATYPVVRRLVGGAFFDATVDHFVRAHPSASGDVNRYGGELASFLESYRPARDLAYLPDVARLEWAIDQAGIAADAPRFDFDALAAVPADEQGSLRFSLHPSTSLVSSAYPIFHIWRVNQPGEAADERVDLAEGGEVVLVSRRRAGVAVEKIASGDFALLAALGTGANLTQAAMRARDAQPDFDLAAALRRHVAAETIVAFTAPEPNKERRA